MKEPWIQVDIDSVTVDLHGYGWMEGTAVGAAVVEQAWLRGLKSVKLIHGKSSSRAFGRSGTIKWSLRGLLAHSHLLEFAYYRRSVRHAIYDGSMVLALKPNPMPIKDEFPTLTELEELAQAWHWCLY